MGSEGGYDPASTRRVSGVPGRSMSLVPKMSMAAGASVAGGEGTAPRENRIVINVGGVRHETYKSTLRNIPDTRLSWMTETTAQNADYDPLIGEYFFDRHPDVFTMILNYYRTGKLHAPMDVCGPMFEEELAFWGIDEKQIEPCCWMTYRTHRDAQETLKEMEGREYDTSDGEDDDDNVAERFGLQEDDEPEISWWRKWQPKMWSLLEEPQSSTSAQVLAVISLCFVLLSIATFCLETDITFRVPRNESDPVSNDWTNTEKNNKSKPHQALEILDFICIVYFTLEFTIRLLFTPSKKMFFKTTLNWVDLCSIVPFYIERTIVWINPEMEYSTLLQILKTIRLIRIFRIFKLTRHFSGLKILVHTIKASARELLLLIMFLCITVLIFACLIYYAESINEHSNNDFKNIPIGFWWAVVTMTTIGYGDMYPRTGMGYFVGGICAVAGVLVLALPVPVIVNNFALYYSHAQARLKLPKKRKKILVGAADALKTQTAMPVAGSSFDSQSNRSTSPTKSTDLPSSPGTARKESDDNESSRENSIQRGSASSNYSEKSLGISVIYTDETFNPRDNQVKANHVTSVGNGNIYPPLAMKSNGHAFHKRHTMEDLYVVQEEDELSEGNTRKDGRARKNSVHPAKTNRPPPPARRCSLTPHSH